MEGISIVIHLYNKESTIHRTISELLIQKGCNFEIVVVDDGSTDRSLDIARSFGAKVSVYSQKNSGPSAARNFGAAKAKYPYLIFLDADDELLPGCLLHHMNLRSKYPNAKLTLVSFTVNSEIDGSLLREESLVRRIDPESDNDDLFVQQFDFQLVKNIHSGGFCVNRDVFVKASGYDERLQLWEITDALIRFTMNCSGVAITNQKLSRKYEEPQNSQFARASAKSNQYYIFGANLISYYEKLPSHAQSSIAKQLKYIIFWLWEKRELDFFMLLLYRARKTINADQLSLPFKIKIFYRCATPFFRKNRI